MHACLRVCVCARACVRACVRVCGGGVCVCLHTNNSHAFTNASLVQCPYSARTVPVQCPYSARTVPDLIFLLKSLHTRFAPCVLSLQEMKKAASFSGRAHVFPRETNKKLWSGTVRALYGHCTGTVRALYGHCAGLGCGDEVFISCSRAWSRDHWLSNGASGTH